MKTVFLIVVLVIGTAAAGMAAAAVDPFADFAARVAAYVTLHREAERGVPPQRLFTNPAEGQAAVAAMAEAIRARRPDAREGDLFTVDSGRAIRRLVRTTLGATGIEGRDLYGDDQMALEPEQVPVVNGAFPWGASAALPPSLLHALPPLPDELQYRFVGADLVLVDVHASLVVDILRDVLELWDPAARTRIARSS